MRNLSSPHMALDLGDHPQLKLIPSKVSPTVYWLTAKNSFKPDGDVIAFSCHENSLEHAWLAHMAEASKKFWDLQAKEVQPIEEKSNEKELQEARDIAHARGLASDNIG